MNSFVHTSRSRGGKDNHRGGGSRGWTIGATGLLLLTALFVQTPGGVRARRQSVCVTTLRTRSAARSVSPGNA